MSQKILKITTFILFTLCIPHLGMFVIGALLFIDALIATPIKENLDSTQQITAYLFLVLGIWGLIAICYSVDTYDQRTSKTTPLLIKLGLVAAIIAVCIFQHSIISANEPLNILWTNNIDKQIPSKFSIIMYAIILILFISLIVFIIFAGLLLFLSSLIIPTDIIYGAYLSTGHLWMIGLVSLICCKLFLFDAKHRIMINEKNHSHENNV